MRQCWRMFFAATRLNEPGRHWCINSPNSCHSQHKQLSAWGLSRALLRGTGRGLGANEGSRRPASGNSGGVTRWSVKMELMGLLRFNVSTFKPHDLTRRSPWAPIKSGETRSRSAGRPGPQQVGEHPSQDKPAPTRCGPGRPALRKVAGAMPLLTYNQSRL